MTTLHDQMRHSTSTLATTGTSEQQSASTKQQQYKRSKITDLISASIPSAAVSRLRCKGECKVTAVADSACREFAKLVEANAVADVACREFAKLVEANAMAQVPESAFEVDPGLRDIIETQIKQEEGAVHQVWRRILPLMPAVMLCNSYSGV